MRRCGTSEKQLEYELRGTGLWGEAVRQRRAVITNDYAAPSPLKKGIPEGHVPITRHLNVPVLDSGRIVLVAGVGNKAAPYTEADARNLSFLMAEAWKIASHQQIEAALRESEEHFRSFIRFAPVPIVITDERGRFEHLNDRFTRTFGYTLEDLPDLETWWRRAYPDEEYREEVLGVWREAMEAGRWTATRSNPLEYRVTCRDGSTRVAEISSNHIGDRYLYLFNDLTGRKRAEEAMSRLQEQYLQAQKMEAIGRLAGGVAHDFNNLLTAILGYAEMIGTEQALTPLAREGIEEIEKSARRAAALTQQLLAFGRKQLLQPRVVDLNGLLADLEKMLRRLIGEDILLTSSLEAAGALVLADPGQIEQAIINLAVNARDAMPRGGTLTIGTRNASVGDEQDGRPGRGAAR